MPHEESVSLRPVTAANWRQCADLDVLEHQRPWLPSNLHSIAAAQFYPESFCRGVYVGERVVGFAMYGVEQPTGRVKIFRLMIDSGAQRRGFGSAAMRLTLQEIAERWPGSAVYVSHHDENAVARRLYEGFGFYQVDRVGSKITACKVAGGRVDGGAGAGH